LYLDISEAATRILELGLLEKKIILATEGFMTKSSESTLRDKLSKENALAVADYIIAMISNWRTSVVWTHATDSASNLIVVIC